MNRVQRQYINSCELSEIVSLPLGGYEQKILIEGYKEGTPIVVFLHGGPGFPAPFCVGARGLFSEITKQFTAVYWDQLGCGINNRVIDDGFSVSHFVDMTVDLIGYLKKRFSTEKLYLFGISWGSLLAARAARSVPQLIDGVFTVGQIILPPMLSEQTFVAIAQSKAPQKTKREIARMKGGAPNVKQIALLSKTVRKYTDAYGIKDKSAAAENPMKDIFKSKDYRFRDKIACFTNGYRKNTSLLTELSRIDLRDCLAQVTIPYRIYGGDRDLVTSVKDAEQLAAESGNENLSVTVMSGEGHVPTIGVQKKIFADIAQAAGV